MVKFQFLSGRKWQLYDIKQRLDNIVCPVHFLEYHHTVKVGICGISIQNPHI
jgi:hypothetical protein